MESAADMRFRGGSKVYPIVQIIGEEIKKPYFETKSWISYIRVGASTSPASRASIIHLFSDIRTKVETEKLAISAEFLKEMIMCC